MERWTPEGVTSNFALPLYVLKRMGDSYEDTNENQAVL